MHWARRISVPWNAIQTVDYYFLNCIRRNGNSTHKTDPRFDRHMKSSTAKLFDYDRPQTANFKSYFEVRSLLEQFYVRLKRYIYNK